MRRAAFEKMVEEILDELPEEFAEKIENVEFVVEARPDPETRRKFRLDDHSTLLGYYQGVPLKYRSPTWYSGVLPDRIVIFQETIEASVSKRGNLRDAVRRTILHEIAHYFGISDKRLREIGAY